MDYINLVESYEKIEKTTKRLEIIEILVELFKNTPNDVIDKVVYLTMGKLYPDYVGIEIGIADKLAIKSISLTTGINEEEIKSSLNRIGDLGLVAEEMVAKKKQKSLFFTPLTVERVYTTFKNIGAAIGGGAQELKMKLISEILHDSKPKEAKYIIRAIIGKLRLGVGDMTIIDALAKTFAKKEERDEIENTYNRYPDLGAIAVALKKGGIEKLKEFKLKIGVPVRAMLAERLTSIEEIFEKTGGECAFEYKYDGLRIQAHIGKEITLFSRRLENVTSQFPDIVNELREVFKGHEAIVEGEAVPVNLHTGEILPFQEISHRRGRKYDVDSAIEEYPVVLFLFDCLLLDGEEMIWKDYLKRRSALNEAMRPTSKISISDATITSDKTKAEEFFQKSIESGCEGLIAKSISAESFYRAGARGWQWIKFKRDYKAEMHESADLVIVGAFAGKGRRAGTYGALLMAAYNKEKDRFETVCKLGTGFKDELLSQLPKKLSKYIIPKIYPNVESKLKPDFWLIPEVVIEVSGAEITLSPVHTCCLGKIKKGYGLAIRFPRFTGIWRSDKGATDATTSEEFENFYRRQLKKIEV
ncbi:MAG: ATP-dependent DNA ligase [Candidatus Thermoplasmatota archaeon]